MSVYTKTGDKGETSLANGKRISKADARIEAYGTVDELNSWIGLLRAEIANVQPLTSNSQPPTTGDRLQWLQNKLFNLGAALSEAPGEWISDTDVQQLEQWIDQVQSQLPNLHAFVLPSGHKTACDCHISRTVCRRAERRMIEANASEVLIRFINRLSDYLFVLALYLNVHFKTEEETWKKD